MKIRVARKPFRAWLWNQYMANKEEYYETGCEVPHTFEEYVAKNILYLKAKYRLTYRRRDSIV